MLLASTWHCVITVAILSALHDFISQFAEFITIAFLQVGGYITIAFAMSQEGECGGSKASSRQRRMTPDLEGLS